MSYLPVVLQGLSQAVLQKAGHQVPCLRPNDMDVLKHGLREEQQRSRHSRVGQSPADHLASGSFSMQMKKIKEIAKKRIGSLPDTEYRFGHNNHIKDKAVKHHVLFPGVLLPSLQDYENNMKEISNMKADNGDTVELSMPVCRCFQAVTLADTPIKQRASLRLIRIRALKDGTVLTSRKVFPTTLGASLISTSDPGSTAIMISVLTTPMASLAEKVK
jgi:hypothetical protein